MQIDKLRAEHEELKRISAELLDAIDSQEMRPVAAIRWRLARALIPHLAMEDQWLYSSLTSSDGHPAADIAQHLCEETGDLATRFRTYMSEWTDERIALHWERFRAETRKILAIHARRTAGENDLLFPAIEDWESVGLRTPRRLRCAQRRTLDTVTLRVLATAFPGSPESSV